jgi:hypothetical protein
MAKNADLKRLIAERENYDEDSRAFIESLEMSEREIGSIEEMKRTSGWKILNKKIREELVERISELVKDDLKVQTLLALLNVADTKKLSSMLDAAIEEILPSG